LAPFSGWAGLSDEKRWFGESFMEKLGLARVKSIRKGSPQCGGGTPLWEIGDRLDKLTRGERHGRIKKIRRRRGGEGGRELS